MAEPARNITLKVGDRLFDGWTSVEVETGIDALSGRFSLALSDRWPGQPDQWKIEAGDACRLFVGDAPVLSGWIDRASLSLDPDSHPVTMDGRERTCDLVDCSALNQPGFWTGRTVLQIATELAQPFGIAVSADVDVGRPFDRFALEPGETVFEAIERMTRVRGLLMLTTVDGDLRLTRPAQTRAAYALEEGVNLKSVAFVNDVAGRFSRYLVKGHDASDESAGTAAARPSAEATDPAIRRHRPLLIVNDEESTTATLEETARWETTVRAGQSQSVTARLSGFHAPDGSLYAANVLVPVRAPSVGVEADLLVESVRFSRSARQGASTELRLAPPQAYSLQPIPEPRAARRQATPPPQDAAR